MSRTELSSLARCMLLGALALGATGCTSLRAAALDLWELHASRERALPCGPGASRLAGSAHALTPLRATESLPSGLRPEALIALGGLSRWSADNEFAVEVATAAWKRKSDPARSIRVVYAHVNLYRRIVLDDGSGAALEPRIGLLARELSPDGKLKPGTEIQVVYRDDEQRSARHGDASVASDTRETPVGAESGEPGSLFAVQIGRGPSARRAFFLRDDSRGVSGFYTREGRPLERRYLRYPVEHMLLTSRFSWGRPHPILKKRKPHYGIDFAAPRGTPVVAVADGEVVEASWAGPYGRRVGIRHADGTVSGYAHLERIAPGIVEGVRVRKGEVVGAVGSSGLATGPHLHFSLVRGGKFVDPATALNPAAPVLTGAALSSLRATAAAANVALALAERDEALAKRKKLEPTRVARSR